jgi:hypothetical protein
MIKTTKQLSAYRQIVAAIEHLHKKDHEYAGSRVGFAKLRDLGVSLIAADSPSSFSRRWSDLKADPADTRRRV